MIYTFPVHLELDEGAWLARVPELESIGAATWGRTREEALRHMQDVMEMIVEEYIEEGKEVPRLAVKPGGTAVTVDIR